MDLINLYIEYFDSSHQQRKNEIIDSINQNLSLKFISNYYIFANNFDWLSSNDTRIIKIISLNRCSFYYLFDFINKNTVDNAINILINNDIILTDTFKNINISNDEFYAISRYENIYDPHPYEHTTGWSQDVWVWRGKNKIVPDKVNFYLGIKGCDNRLAHEASLSYKQVCNPSYTYKAIHNHKSNIRSKYKNPVGLPFKLIKPEIL